MAPLPVNNTVTWFADYEGPMGERSFQFRTTGETSDNDAAVSLNAFLTIMLPVMYASITFIGLRKREQGSDVSFPVPWVARVGTGSGTMQPQDYPRFVSFVGRSNDGRRVRFSLYGVTLPVSTDYRLNLAENAAISSAVGFLNGGACPWVTISGNDPIWQLYSNQGYNAYFQQEQRNNA